MREGRGGGKEREAPTHLIKIQNLPMLHVLLKIGKTTRYLAKKMAVCVAHNPPLRRDKAIY